MHVSDRDWESFSTLRNKTLDVAALETVYSTMLNTNQLCPRIESYSTNRTSYNMNQLLQHEPAPAESQPSQRVPEMTSQFLML